MACPPPLSDEMAHSASLETKTMGHGAVAKVQSFKNHEAFANEQDQSIFRSASCGKRCPAWASLVSKACQDARNERARVRGRVMRSQHAQGARMSKREEGEDNKGRARKGKEREGEGAGRGRQPLNQEQVMPSQKFRTQEWAIFVHH